MGLRSFLGILPPKLSYSFEIAPVEEISLPSIIRLLWPKATASDLALGVGDTVMTGQDLARSGKGPFISVVSGKITDISPFLGLYKERHTAVTIEPGPHDLYDTGLNPMDEFNKADPFELRTAITRAGFDTFSSITKDMSEWPPIKTLIITALDRDPSSLVNQQRFRDNNENPEPAIELLLRSTGASRCILIVPEHLRDMTRPFSQDLATIQLVPPVYPNGLPELLANNFGKGLLIRGTTEGFIGDTVVVGIDHALDMMLSLRNGRPLMKKTITFSSSMDQKILNYRVRIGTPVAVILEKAGVNLQPEGKLIMDGKMRGYACYSDQQPITASTESVLIQAPSHVFSFQQSACINCGRCNAICPVNLEVNFLGRCSEYGLFSRCITLGAENCIDCGLCAYVCPSHRPLVQLISHAKQVIRSHPLQPIPEEESLSREMNAHPLPAVRLFETVPEERNKAGGDPRP
ncbi:MAG: hypothetical protein ABIG67_09350 [Pseudomonadota bacterium]